MVKCKDKFKSKSKRMACFSKKAMSAVLSTAMVSMMMTNQIVIPYSGNYLCTDIGGASNGVGSSYSGNKFGMTQDPGCNLMKSGTGTRYMAKGTYKFSFDLGLGGNSGAYTDYSHRVEAKDTHNRCKVCGHMEGDEETIEVAMVQNLFPVSMAAEENTDEVLSETENGTDVITPYMVFIICILKDYLKLIGNEKGVMWDYYRNRFSKLTDGLAAQIEYDYEKQAEICRKKLSAGEKEDDTRGEAVMLAVKKGRKTGRRE